MKESKVLELFDNFKIVTYVSRYQAKPFFIQLTEKVVNHLGEYRNCISMSEVCSVWVPTAKAKPFIGEANKTSQVSEIRFEFSCSKADLGWLVDYIKSIHPYEKPEVDIIPIILG